LRLFFKCFPLLLLVIPSLAQAHPHVWVKMRTGVIFNDQGLIEGINVEWTFDDAYAAEALTGMDANGDGEYSQDELKPLTKENMDSLKDYNYFTYMKADGKPLAAATPINAGQTYNGKKLQLHFEVPLQKPFDPRSGEFMVKIYDPEFFIAFDYAKEEPVDADGTVPAGCKVNINPLLTDAEMNQTLAMLATKDREWKPENGEDFGSLFAQLVDVKCQSS
jgi:ABC-type uncharacterized transport system substrate-binding protein